MCLRNKPALGQFAHKSNVVFVGADERQQNMCHKSDDYFALESEQALLTYGLLTRGERGLLFRWSATGVGCYHCLRLILNNKSFAEWNRFRIL